MRLRCAFNRSEMLADHQRGRVADVESVYPLSVGVGYVVLGMGLWENVLSVLVRDDWGKPCFAPAGLFELGVHDVPVEWRFGLCSGIRASGRELWTDPCGAVWGYQELVDDPAHPAALEERDAAALMIFASRFAEAEARSESS